MSTGRHAAPLIVAFAIILVGRPSNVAYKGIGIVERATSKVYDRNRWPTSERSALPSCFAIWSEALSMPMKRFQTRRSARSVGSCQRAASRYSDDIANAMLKIACLRYKIFRAKFGREPGPDDPPFFRFDE
jgi:hypothetical protein